MEKRIYSVAIDGPSGAGKSTIARMAAKELGFLYVDTGALYRTIGLYVMRTGIASTDEAGVTRLLPDIEVDIKYENGEQRTFLGGEDVSELIRTPEASRYASDVSAMGPVRGALLNLQRSLAQKNSVIMDGRDIGTVVLPNADVKIFLTAGDEERARRRYDELKAKGVDVSFDKVLHDMRERDKNDESRAIAPLKRADDATLIDTTSFDLDRSVELVLRAIREKIKDVL